MTVLPELESGLVEAAARLRPGRRRRRAATRSAVVAFAVAALGFAFAISTQEHASDVSQPSPREPAPLSGSAGEGRLVNPGPDGLAIGDLLGVFRREATPRDATGTSIEELEATGDRQPGEDTTRSRRIDLPIGPVYLWPMKNGVCSSWGNCLDLEALRKLGVAVATEGGARPSGGFISFVSGIVVDGIDEVRLVRADNSEMVIPVTENVFRVDLSELSQPPIELRWSDARGERTFDLARSFPDLAPPKLTDCRDVGGDRVCDSE